MNVYLDIDGVILANDKKPANHVKEFLEYLTAKFPVYWLTTHCHGDASYTLHFLSELLDPETLQIAAKIKPTDWMESKTEAIDFSTPFRWFDDHLFDIEKEDLIRHNALESWIRVDLARDPDQLLKIVSGL